MLSRVSPNPALTLPRHAPHLCSFSAEWIAPHVFLASTLALTAHTTTPVVVLLCWREDMVRGEGDEQAPAVSVFAPPCLQTRKRSEIAPIISVSGNLV